MTAYIGYPCLVFGGITLITAAIRGYTGNTSGSDRAECVALLWFILATMLLR